VYLPEWEQLHYREQVFPPEEEKRVREAIKLGFRTCVIPRGNLLDKGKLDIKIIEISDIKQLIRMVQ